MSQVLYIFDSCLCNNFLPLSFPVCDNMGELYRNCDLDTVVNFLAKQVNFFEITLEFILNVSECVEADRDEPEGNEGGVDATVRHHTRLLQVALVTMIIVDY